MQGHKPRGREERKEGRKKAGKENSLVLAGCHGKPWGNQVWEGDLSTIWEDAVPWNPPTPKGKITVPKDNGFSTLCYFNPSLSAHGIPGK